MHQVPKYADWRSQIWKSLQEKYPDDPELKIIHELDRIIAGPLAYYGSEPDDRIITTIEKFFLTNGNKPAPASTIDTYLRMAGIDLPPQGKSASGFLAQVMFRSPLFERVPVGISPNRTSKWRLADKRVSVTGIAGDGISRTGAAEAEVVDYPSSAPSGQS